MTALVLAILAIVGLIAVLLFVLMRYLGKFATAVTGSLNDLTEMIRFLLVGSDRGE